MIHTRFFIKKNHFLSQTQTAVTGELMDIYSCNDVIFVGDFNRDGKADLFCHDSNEHVHYAFSNSINDNVSFGGLLTNSLKWCDGPSDVIVPGKASVRESNIHYVAFL